MKNDGKWNPVNMFIKLDWTPCHFGGYRPWFLCPRCGRRAAILYAGQYFYCRVCRDLAYPSENEGRLDRLYRQANKIRRRLNCEPGALNPINIPPKGMHEKTFDRLRSRVLMYEDRALRCLWDRLPHNWAVICLHHLKPKSPPHNSTSRLPKAKIIWLRWNLRSNSDHGRFSPLGLVKLRTPWN